VFSYTGVISSTNNTDNSFFLLLDSSPASESLSRPGDYSSIPFFLTLRIFKFCLGPFFPQNPSCLPFRFPTLTSFTFCCWNLFSHRVASCSFLLLLTFFTCTGSLQLFPPPVIVLLPVPTPSRLFCVSLLILGIHILSICPSFNAAEGPDDQIFCFFSYGIHASSFYPSFPPDLRF